MIRVFDIETDGLDPTLIHVVSWSDDMGQPKSTHDYEEMRSLFTDGVTLCGHNIIRYDIPAVEKILGIEVKSRLIDTLGLSWYLNYWKPKHGLAEYGVEYGVPKPKIDDWENLDKEEYRNRCEQDVRINQVLWKNLDYKLSKLYKETEDKDRLIDYLSFKLKCAATQEYLQWKLDVAKAVDYRDEWLELKSNKIELLADAMPKKVLTTVRNQPKVYHKKDGSISSKGQEWEDLCREQKQPATTKSLTVITGYERANPNSVDQVKDWLFSLGWTPRTFKFLRDKATGETRELEQVRKDSDLCDSVKELSGVEPAINLLDGLSVLTHRIGVISGMIDKQKDGYVKASIAGLTNTLRFKHAKPLVNLPSVDKPYGSEIRGCLTCPDDMILCGADMTSLEDTTKRHYMKPLDPDYVEEMSKEGSPEYAGDLLGARS